jgi:hypothetical protein
LGEEHHADSPVVEKAAYAFGVDFFAFLVKRDGGGRYRLFGAGFLIAHAVGWLVLGGLKKVETGVLRS